MNLACFFTLFLNQILESIYQLFSWTSVAPSKFLINKMIGSQGHITV